MKNKTKNKIRSKKGMTLVEIVVGIALVVIVFSSCLGAMVGGYTTTIKNADENKIAVLNASLNELLVNTVRDLKLTESAVSPTGEINDARITETVTEYLPSALYVKPSEYPKNDVSVDFQYTIAPVVDDKTALTKGSEKSLIKGIVIKTCFNSSKGANTYQSFVPFTKTA